MKEEFACDNCNNPVTESDEFCPHCGSLFVETKCLNHLETDAQGVCVICCSAFCSDCITIVNEKSFCNEHSEYEIYENMARVYGSSDSVHIDYLNSCLENEGLHPLIFSRKASPMHFGGTDYSLFRASGDYNGYLVNEIKLMLPFQEVLHAEEIIENLEPDD